LQNAGGAPNGSNISSLSIMPLTGHEIDINGTWHFGAAGKITIHPACEPVCNGNHWTATVGHKTFKGSYTWVVLGSI
jgi:hypothetical protein